MTTEEIVFIADFFVEDYLGGAELNDDALMSRFPENFSFIKKRCHEIDLDFINEHRYKTFIIGNFVRLSEQIKNALSVTKYIIYEHDHKYLKSRNPISYIDFKAPKEELNNFDFYKNSQKVVVLTEGAREIYEKNLNLNNSIRVGASVWKKEHLEQIKQILLENKAKKENVYAIMNSLNPIKRKQSCIEFCNKNNFQYELIKDNNYLSFLKKISEYEKMVFLTGHYETCGRIVVEAKMLGCQPYTNKKLIGAASEEWYSLSGLDLIQKMEEISSNSYKFFLK